MQTSNQKQSIMVFHIKCLCLISSAPEGDQNVKFIILSDSEESYFKIIFEILHPDFIADLSGFFRMT